MSSDHHQEDQSLSMSVQPLPTEQSFTLRSRPTFPRSVSRRSASSASTRITSSNNTPSFRNFSSQFNESISYTSYSNINALTSPNPDDSPQSMARPRIFVAPSGTRYCIDEHGRAVPPPLTTGSSYKQHEPPIAEETTSAPLHHQQQQQQHLISNDPPPPPPLFPPVHPMEPSVEDAAPSRRCLQQQTPVVLLSMGIRSRPQAGGAHHHHQTLCSRCGTTCWVLKESIVFRCPDCSGVSPATNIYTMQQQHQQQQQRQPAVAAVAVAASS